MYQLVVMPHELHVVGSQPAACFAGLGALPRVRGWEHVADGEATHAPVIFNHISCVSGPCGCEESSKSLASSIVQQRSEMPCRYVDALILAAYFAPCGVAKARARLLQQWLPVASVALAHNRKGAVAAGWRRRPASLWVHHSRSPVSVRGSQRDDRWLSAGDSVAVQSMSMLMLALLRQLLCFSDVVNKYTMVGDVREQVAKREVDPRYPRFMLAPEATTKPGHTLLR